jgi:WD40 repeat protein
LTFGEVPVSLRLVVSLNGHSDQVRDVAFSTNGKLLASCSDDGTVRLWNIETNESIAAIRVQDEPLYSLALSPDNKTLATAGLGGTLSLWNVDSRLKASTYRPKEWTVSDIAWLPDGKTLVLQNGRGLVVVPTDGGEPTTVEFDRDIIWGRVDSMAVAHDGERVAVGGHAATLAIWSRKQNEVVGAFSALPNDVENLNNLSTVMALAFSPTHDRLAVSSGFKIASTVTAWDPTAKTLKTRFAGSHGTVWGLTYSPNGKLLAGAGDSLVIWDADSGEVLDTWDDKGGRDALSITGFHAYNLAFSSNGRLIASGGFDKSVKVFSVYEK